MKITQLREKDGNMTLSTMDLDTFLQKIKTETKTKPISTYREQLRYTLPDKRCGEANRLPQVIPAAEFRKTDGVRQMKAYNGIVELTVGPLSGKAEVALVKRRAWEQPQTRLVFTGSSGRTVKIWTTFTRPDNSLPRKQEEAETFHAHAYRLAVKCYQPQLPFDILLKEPKLEQYSRLSFDPEALYRPDSAQFYLVQPASMPDEPTYRETVQGEKSPLTRALPGYEAEEAVIMLFEAAVQKTFTELAEAESKSETPIGEDLQPIVTRLAENCFRSGIPEEETVKRTSFHYYFRQKEALIRQTVRSVYQECKGFNTQCSLSKEQRLAIQTDEFMKRRYDFRYNTQVGEVEFRERHSFRFRFSPIDKRALNSIALDAQSEGIPLWDRDISRYIYSNRVPVFNPLEDYLYNLPRWDGQDRIRALAQTVPCRNPHWAELFHRWFLNMVAHWRGSVDKKYANSVSPLLVGAQGTRKSTFCRIIVPLEIRAYYTDSIDFSRKRDAELSLNRFALINIDEFDQISMTQQGFLKHILQKPVVNVRKPYGNAVLEMRRYASFIATSNQKDLLTDPSGSRRFICIEVTGVIDTTRPIDYSQLYAQAMYELDHGERYWFDQSDERIMTENNHDFEQIPPEEQLFYRYFRIAKNDEEGEWLSSAEILNRIRRYSAIPLSTKKVNVFGRILQKHEIPSKRTRFGTLYHVVECDRYP
ncbi:virE N-terminal domain protein [Bacteroides intestinalis CAG:315]|uniref:Helicase n=1 Tax=Bacteroides intestinalis TaxID=329854 RepID=A0A412XYD8_9BACE|nr:BT4734/BF3469 family protein [Bacteroides intestinalis]RGV50253.1 helicase [Bacteroides intestinalis]RHA56463.1 helicase [Bacteroides intestinalis]CDD91008.1 virE N-terminal domain protein [Bacteroides intestinalis CAG:315]